MVHGVHLLCPFGSGRLSRIAAPPIGGAACFAGPGCPRRSGPATAAPAPTAPLLAPAPAPGLGPHRRAGRGDLAELSHLPHLHHSLDQPYDPYCARGVLDDP